MSANKAKGTRFESEVVNYLRPFFPRVERRALGGANDKGDISGIDGWVFELKNTRRIDLGEFMAEAEREAKNAQTDQYAVVIKRRMRGANKAYAVVPLEMLASLILTYEEFGSMPGGPELN